MKNFDPVNVEELAVHTKKVQEVEEWLKVVHTSNCSDILLLTGPVGCGKTSTLLTLASKYCIKVTEWITPLDIEMPTENGKPLSNSSSAGRHQTRPPHRIGGICHYHHAFGGF